MDPRLYMLAGTFSLLVVALVATIVSAIRASRRSRYVPDVEPDAHWEWPVAPPVPGQEPGTSLDGFELEVPGDSPCAALLTPLRTGSWEPPDESAPVAGLSSLSLDARLASFDSAFPAAAIPDFEHGRLATEPIIHSMPVPEVFLAEPISSAESLDSPAPVEPLGLLRPEPIPESFGDTLPLEAADIEEHPSSCAPDIEYTSSFPVPDWAAMVPQVTGPVAPLPPDDGPTRPEPALPVPIDEVSCESILREPVDVLSALAPPEPAVSPSPSPSVPEVVAVADTPTLTTPPESVAIPPASSLPLTAPVAETVEIADSASVFDFALSPDPASAPVLPSAPDPLPEWPARPRTVVRSIDHALNGIPQAPPREQLSPAPKQHANLPARSELADMVMAAPVEIWIGDSRIGVKAGTRTYTQFRKFADVLFEDLAKSKS